MPFWVAVVSILSILAVFGTPIVIVKMVIEARRRSHDLPAADIEALRAEVAALREDMEASRGPDIHDRRRAAGGAAQSRRRRLAPPMLRRIEDEAVEETPLLGVQPVVERLRITPVFG